MKPALGLEFNLGPVLLVPWQHMCYFFHFHQRLWLSGFFTQSCVHILRDDQPRSNPFPGEGLPNAAPGELSQGTLRNHAGVLEEQARGPAHF